MRRKAIAAIALLTIVVSWGCSRAPEPAPQAARTPDPAQLIQEMFDTLSQARQLTFTATRRLDAALVIGGSVAESAEIEMSVSRPQKVRARSMSDAGVRVLYADGHTVALSDEAMKVYATAPVAGSIDDVVAALDDRYGFTPPLAEFILNDPQKKFSSQVQDSQYKGKEPIDGVECDRVTLTGEIADADVWISPADHLPRKFVATFKDREGSPQLTIDFSQWNLAATLDESIFTFDPPKDAEKIVMTTIEEANASATKGGTK
jgi:hypothetical protein